MNPDPDPSSGTIAVEAEASVKVEDISGSAAEEEYAGAGKLKRVKQPPINVNLGTWDIDEIQICEMGSHGPEGEYVRVGGISLL